MELEGTFTRIAHTQFPVAQPSYRPFGLRPHAPAPLRYGFPATWRSGYAAACKAVYTGSIPVVASN